MADTRFYPSIPSKKLKTDILSTDSTFVLRDIKWYTGSDSVDVNLTSTIFGTGNVGYGVFEPATARQEFFTFNPTNMATAATTGLTIIARGLPWGSDYTTSSTTRQFNHASGSSVLLFTNAPDFYNQFSNKGDDETITQTWTFTAPNYPRMDSAAVAPTADEQLATKKYADDLAIAGAPDASATVKGLSEIASDAELAASAADGSGNTTAPLVAHAASFNTTSTANKVPVANASGVLDDGYIALTTRGDLVTRDATGLARLAVGAANRYLTTDGTDLAWGGANLDEANTFFGATDILGAEAETLTALSGNANALHLHG